jgi:TM2 domain-containing membrane protein YozV
MQKILFIILFNLFFGTTLFSQDIHQIKSYSDDQFEKGNYTVALKEYQRVQLFDNEKLYNDIYSKIASIYFNQADYNNAIRYLNFAWTVEQNDSIKFELAIKKTLCNLLLNDNYTALTELFDISEYNSEYFQNKKNLYTGICYFGLADYNESNSYLVRLVDSVGALGLNKIFTDYIKYIKKYNPEKIELMSSIVPGLGQIYIGEIGSGINSIALLTGIVAYAFHTTTVYGYIDGVLVLSSWFYRYYNGGKLKANIATQEKLEKKKIQVYSEILTIVEQHQKTKF